MSLKVEIYTKSSCPYSIRAKHLLNSKGIAFTEYSVDGDEVGQSLMAQRSNGQRSVPQIFIQEQHIGGCQELYELERQGKLDEILRKNSV
ncbi:MAG: glutaredoxin 3 [Fischerella sp.]|jgi:glutaredoxin 3|uniref:glutaredoxin 3 n=1 Tax=Fischerella sp. TaxID=1191 RepID=UPI0018467E34|nr:glutaredoxin 3 [Fischerella sp.]NWF59573.1 glutaredoxin 3 [Fischerella sp.]